MYFAQIFKYIYIAHSAISFSFFFKSLRFLRHFSK